MRLGYDTSLFTGPVMAPGWPRSYVTTGNVTPISSLEVDQGRLTASGAPQDANDPENFRPRTFAPAAEAAAAFAGFLAARRDPGARGGEPDGRAARGGGHRRGEVAAAGRDRLLDAQPEQQRDRGEPGQAGRDRHRAARLVQRRGRRGDGGAAQARRRRQIRLVDGSGLSPEDRIAPDALVQLIRLAAAASRPGLRAVITGLPVAGFSGTLAPGGSVFPDVGQAGLGVVRAKTGNLSTVVSLAGIAEARDGQLFAFAFMADRLQQQRPGRRGVRPDQAGHGPGGLRLRLSARPGASHPAGQRTVGG